MSYLVTSREAAERLDVPVLAVYELAAAGAVEHRYIGPKQRCFRLTSESVERLARGGVPVADLVMGADGQKVTA